MEILPIKTRLFQEKEDLTSFIFKHVKNIPNNSILVVASKIVALSQGRTANVKDKEKLIKRESTFAIPTQKTWLTIKDGMVMASAGIDESNAKGKLVLLPKDPFGVAGKIHQTVCKKLEIKNLGVIISDSSLLPMRSGAIGLAIGYAGFKGVRNYIGKKDIFGRVLKMSRTDVADSLATAAVLCMGEGDEQQPLTLITNAPVEFVEKVDKKEMRIATKKDLYSPLFKHIKYGKKK